MEKCVRCGISEEELRLFDGIYVNEVVKICERCALLSDVPLIKRPSAEQLKESEKSWKVRERLGRMAKVEVQTERAKIENSIRLNDIENIKPKGNEKIEANLVDNYHWVLMVSRRKRGLTVKQLAEAIGESESAIKFLEKKIIPEESLELLRKLEQFYNVRIFKKKPEEVIRIETIPYKIQKEMKERREIINLEKEKANRIEKIREEEGEDMLREAILEEKEPKILIHEEVNGTPLRILDFKKAKNENLSIAELKIIQDKIDKDFTHKTAYEVGEEQVEDIGREDTESIKRRIYGNFSKEKNKNVPTIYDLMKKKEEKERVSLLGDDIEIEDK
jgi:ribosome-binding protein aMBF1 (putative translation factor)